MGIDGELLAGSIPIKQLKLLQAWLVLHEEEVYAAWNKVVRNIPFEKIEPLKQGGFSMYVVDGIAYAGERKKPVSLLSIRPLDGYRCQVYFNDGRSGIFDMSDALNEPVFAPLKEKDLFDRVYLDFGAPTWCDGNLDIAPEYVYEHTNFSEAEKGA